jgi:sterol desaturase/sphingolipid hydroxylase (fatty acid hydroxylase superfamily)
VSEWMFSHAPLLRFAFVASMFLVLIVIQAKVPKRGQASARGRRLRNLMMPVISAAIVYLLLPLTAVSFAAVVADKQLGLFNHLSWPLAVEFAVTIIAMDLAIYWQHRCMHLIPWLWRVHRLHHTDTDFELTLALRFHPIEIVLSLLYKFLVISVLGAAPLAVLMYEILLSGFALFSHADIDIPKRWDRHLRRIVITPDWHRVHHSVHRRETDSNFGNLLSLWDRIFASAIEQPRDGHLAMRIGLDAFRDEQSQRLPAMLAQPFLNEPDHPRQ